jgi:hypothetical protein
VTRLTQDGIPVNVIDVPLVEATAVPDVINVPPELALAPTAAKFAAFVIVYSY